MSAYRRALRQQKALQATMLIQERLGGASADAVLHVRMASLSAIAEARSVWDFLVTKGLATEAQREDFLDKAFDDLLAQIESAAAEIMVRS